MPPTRLRVLCLGLSPHWVELWRARPDAEVAGLVDLYGEATGNAVTEGPLYHDLPEALTTVKPDLVTLVTPPHAKSRMDAIETVVREGFDIGLEKLRPADWSDGERLLEWGRRSGRGIAIGEAYRFDPLVAAAKSVLESGALGEIDEVVWTCRRPVLSSSWMGAYRHVMLEDLTYHHLGVIHHLTGLDALTRVYATSTGPSWAQEAPPTVVSLIAAGEGGPRLTYHASWAAHGASSSWLGDFRIDGSRGTLSLQDGRLRLTPSGGQGDDGAGSELPPASPYPHEQRAGIVEDYIRACRESRRSVLDIAQTIPVLRLIRAAIESAETGLPAAIRSGGLAE